VKVQNDHHIRTPSRHNSKVAHFVLTRFNVRYVEDPNARSVAIEPSWLKDRFSLFENYCLPSIIAQRNQDFTWLLFFDAATPEAFAQRALYLLSQRERSHAIFCKDLPIERVQEEVRSRLRGAPEWLLTTRLDNDDGLHVDFIGSVRESLTLSAPEIVNAPAGLILKGRKVFAQRHLSNAFISLAEPVSSFKTIFSILRHTEAAKAYPVRQAENRPLWLQVIHSKNISNRVRGWRVPYNDASVGFAALAPLTSPSEESLILIYCENSFFGIARAIRDWSIARVKKAASIIGFDLRRKVRG
jgi:hypothetical protein